MDRDLELLDLWLQGHASNIQVVWVLADSIEPIAISVRKHLPHAALQLVVQNARELDKLRHNRALSNTKIVVGGLGAEEQRANLAILRVSGFEGKKLQRERIEFVRNHLALAGALLVLTHTKRGAKSQLAMIEEIFGNADVVDRGWGGYRALLGRANVDGALPDTISGVLEEGDSDEDSVITAEILGEHYKFYTDSSVFSRERVDPGSKLLLEALPRASFAGSRRVLDLGCGYGVMGVVLARTYPDNLVTMVDIDLRAVELARANVELNGVQRNSQVVLSDGLGQLKGSTFDVVLTHFPLHIPRNDLERLLRDAYGSLTLDGCLYGVMLNAYSIQPIVKHVFGNVETLSQTRKGEYEYAYSILKACRRREDRLRT